MNLTTIYHRYLTTLQEFIKSQFRFIVCYLLSAAVFFSGVYAFSHALTNSKHRALQHLKEAPISAITIVNQEQICVHQTSINAIFYRTTYANFLDLFAAFVFIVVTGYWAFQGTDAKNKKVFVLATVVILLVFVEGCISSTRYLHQIDKKHFIQILQNLCTLQHLQPISEQQIAHDKFIQKIETIIVCENEIIIERLKMIGYIFIVWTYLILSARKAKKSELT